MSADRLFRSVDHVVTTLGELSAVGVDFVSGTGAPDDEELPTTTEAVQAGGWIWRGIAVWDRLAVARASTR